MKAITHFERDDGLKFVPREDGLFYSEKSSLDIHGYSEAEMRAQPRYRAVYEGCKCNHCVDISPRVKRIAAALTPELQKDLEHIMSSWGADALDLDVANARLAGEWPGSEWIIEAKQLYDNAHPVNGHGGLY